jgi:hypothetical protein
MLPSSRYTLRFYGILLLLMLTLFLQSCDVSYAEQASGADTTNTNATDNRATAATSTPSSQPATRPTSSKYRVLFDNAHAESAGNADWVISGAQPDPLKENPHPTKETDWTGGISAWGVALQQTNRYVLMTNASAFTYGKTSNITDLSKFDALILPEPNKRLTASEKTAIMQFVQNGGGLFMISDHDKSDRNNDGIDSPAIFNDLMQNNGVAKDPFGFQIDLKNISSQNLNNLTPQKNPVLNGPFGAVKGSIIRNGTTMTLHTTANAQVRGLIYLNSASPTGAKNAFLVSSSYGKGRVLAIGDSSTIDDGTCRGNDQCYDGWNDPAAQDRALFLNGTAWLAKAI